MTRVCGSGDLNPGEMLVFDEGAEPILVCNVDGVFFATQDTCTHDEWSLSEGELAGDVVECSLHWAKFCVRTGEVKAPPATQSLKTFTVEIRGDNVLVDVEGGTDSSAEAKCGTRCETAGQLQTPAKRI